MIDRTINFKVSQEMYDHLVRLTHEKSLKEKKNYCLSDIIRISLEQTYPMQILAVLPGKEGSGKCKNKRTKLEQA